MRTRETDVEAFVNLSELTEIELLIMRRMREFTIGEHRSVFHGTGFDYVGLRDWEAGDRLAVSMERVELAVIGTDDDLELLVAVEIREHRR